MKKWILLCLLSIALTGCFTTVQSDNEYKIHGTNYLPPATIDKPYRQIIHIRGSIPRTMWLGTSPKDSGLQFRFLWSDPHKKVETNSGDIIEISGIPKKGEAGVGIDSTPSDRFIYFSINGYGHQGQFDNDLRINTGYNIKLLPIQTNQSSPASSSHQ